MVRILQEVRFDKSRIQDHKADITSFLGFTPNKYELYIFTEKPLPMKI